MTTIAFDGRYVAADRRVTLGDTIMTDGVIKIKQSNNLFYALAGSSASFDAWINFYEKGDPVPNLKDECAGGNFIVFTPGDHPDWEMFSVKCPYAMRCKEAHAWGSGSEFALTAMDLQMSAHDAVITASKRDPYTDDRVDVVDLKTGNISYYDP